MIRISTYHVAVKRHNIDIRNAASILVGAQYIGIRYLLNCHLQQANKISNCSCSVRWFDYKKQHNKAVAVLLKTVIFHPLYLQHPKLDWPHTDCATYRFPTFNCMPHFIAQYQLFSELTNLQDICIHMLLINRYSIYINIDIERIFFNLFDIQIVVRNVFSDRQLSDSNKEYQLYTLQTIRWTW